MKDKESMKYHNTPVQMGYWFIAKPIVELMQEHEFVTQMMAPLIHGWANQMAYQQGASDRQDMVGKMIVDLGVPLSRLVGETLVYFNHDYVDWYATEMKKSAHQSEEEIIEIAIRSRKAEREEFLIRQAQKEATGSILSIARAGR